MAHSSSVLRPSSACLTHLTPGTPVIFSELTLLAQQASEQHHHAEERRKLHTEAGELPAGFPRPYLLWDEPIAQADTAALVNLSNNDLGVGSWELGVGDRHQPPTPNSQPLFRCPARCSRRPTCLAGSSSAWWMTSSGDCAMASR